MARPRKQLDEKLMVFLASINCSYKEIATGVGCNVSTLTARYQHVIEKGRDEGKTSLKRAMWDSAVHLKNTTMMIWLSKQMLGYTDKVTEVISDKIKARAEKAEELSKKPVEEVAAITEDLLGKVVAIK